MSSYTPPKRRKLTKAERQQIYAKCDGHCAYCGTSIAIEQMQVDHIIPIRRGGADELDNMLPACRSCNHYKDSMTIELFRQSVERWPEILMRDSVTYRNAVRFGVVTPTPHQVMFYFEREENDDE